MARRVNLNFSVMNRVESGERPIKDHELVDLADVLGVSTDYLLGITDKKESLSPKLTDKDEKDIAKRMKKIKEDLASGEDGDGLSFMGEPLSDEAKESLFEALEHAERIATLANKKFIPKKHRK